MGIKSSVRRRILLLTIFIALSVPNVAAQVLNMSHDLVSLGIAGQNLAPNVPSQDARPLIQAALQYVQNHPVQVLTLDKGNYYLLTAQQPNAILLFGRLTYNADLGDGVNKATQSKPITRQVFRTPGTVCQ